MINSLNIYNTENNEEIDIYRLYDDFYHIKIIHEQKNDEFYSIYQMYLKSSINIEGNKCENINSLKSKNLLLKAKILTPKLRVAHISAKI